MTTVNKPEVKNSGQKREFGTGAHRDAAEGKGRCDLLPLDVAAELLDSDTLRRLDEFTEKVSDKSLILAIGCFVLEAKISVETALLGAAKQYEAGANVYGANNWKHGIPLHVFLDSGIRHYLKWRNGDTDEHHDFAFMWNMLGAIWTLKHLPAMNDITPKLMIEVEQN